MGKQVDAGKLKAMLEHIGNENDLKTLRLGADANDNVPPLSAAETIKENMSTEQWKAVGDLMDGRIVPRGMLATMFSIVQPIGRPSFIVSNNDFPVDLAWRHLDSALMHARISQALRAVGTIVVPDSFETLCGTGFLVGDRLVMTNRHVAENFSYDLDAATPPFRTVAPLIDFHREKSSPPGDTSGQVPIEKVVMVHPTLDIVLLRLKFMPPGIKPLVLSSTPPKRQDEIAVMGYPRAYRPDDDIERAIFDNTYDVKRLAPGQITGLAYSAERGLDVLTHDSSTLPGNSGSPALDLRTGLVIGVHYRGDGEEEDGMQHDAKGKANYLVPSAALAANATLRQLGVQFA